MQEGPVLTGTEAAGEQGCRAVSPMLSTAGGSPGEEGPPVVSQESRARAASLHTAFRVTRRW